MKLIYALIAVMLLLVSVAAESARADMVRADGTMAHAAVLADEGDNAADVDCLHEEQLGGSEDAGCNFTAYCSLLCGFMTPFGPEGAQQALSAAVLFDEPVEYLTGVLMRPEAPPPRAFFL